MQAGASQASNYRIGQDFQALLRYVKDGQHPKVAEVNLNASIVLELKPSDIRYKSLQNLFATTISEDLISGGVVNSGSELHDHHIYPRNARKRFSLPQARLDGICNRVPVLKASNLHLNEAYPREYFKEMAEKARSQGTLGGLSRRLRNCMIPGDPDDRAWVDGFSIEMFEEFCRKRAQLIVARVGEVVGDSLRSDVSTDEDRDDDN